MIRRLHGRRAFRLAVCLALGATLGGCTELHLGLTVTSDDTVTGQLLVAAEKSALRSARPLPTRGPRFPTRPELNPRLVSIPAAFDELRRKLPALPAGNETRYETPDVYGVLISYRDKPLAEFSGGGVKLVRDGDRYRFTLSLDPTRWGEQAARYDPQAQQDFLRSLSLEISVTFPGRVLDTNGAVYDRSASWKLIADQPKPAELRAVAEAAASPSASAGTTPAAGVPWLLVVGGAVVALLAAGVAVLLLRRPRGPGAAAPAATTPGPTPQPDHPGPV